MQPTKLLYLEDFTVLTNTATVLAVLEENNRFVVVLDGAIFYPQGGGQPYDQGTMENEAGKFIVEEVRFIEGIVKHIGHFEHGMFAVDEQVKCCVNEERRALNSRLHSGGHVVDMAVTALELQWIPGKGYHFPDGPYVEYAGDFEGLDKEKLKRDIEDLCNGYIAQALSTKLVFMKKEEMHTVCHHVPEYLPEGKPARVVLYGDFGVPCGGTHVSNLKEIKQVTVRDIKQKGANVRVGYDVSR